MLASKLEENFSLKLLFHQNRIVTMTSKNTNDYLTLHGKNAATIDQDELLDFILCDEVTRVSLDNRGTIFGFKL